MRTPLKPNSDSVEELVLGEPTAVVSHEKQLQGENISRIDDGEVAFSCETNMISQPPTSISQSQSHEKANESTDLGKNRFIASEGNVTESTSSNCNDEKARINSLPEEKNAFARMLSQSKVMFSSKEMAPKEQCFHLHDNGTVSIFAIAPSHQPLAWQTQITVKDRSLSPDRSPTEFLITLSSALPSHNELTESSRWVKRHSRLSVPVLKSILQKSIRRRRPLPSVKVAMELADKSLGELLRRLPIIVLEDSTLHPDFDLLVWLMMANSKDYSIPPSLLARVFEIIFEICSCPWIDSCSSITPEVDDPPNAIGDSLATASLTSLHEELLTQQLFSQSSSLIWAMLARAEYGGMKGDVQMLRSFATVWRTRFERDDQCPKLNLNWALVPATIHERTRYQAHQFVSELCRNKLHQLMLKDISVQGIDFHCSSIIEHLLSDEPFRELCLDLLKLDEPSAISSSQLPSVLKQCLWDFSAGVNRRQLLEGGRHEPPKNLLNVWNELIASRVSAFQTSYVEQRLASR
ncbi:hypothetical protein FisN_18Lh044 [Fistulifera solaris]|uniref:Uncharacterized protein n=1 Tax=Fistulifera solaris TaxID=1519565 RepID=A0A1Z5KDW5_FISSO|nr:hypothetical protein FisN_18Lh044 [Fistulifera solaris]|eukprot:GAX24494.1 hypothetical protein FisN_18Lh044 [Fistulifera solaris]